MARITLGPLVDEINGAIGSVTFRRIGSRDFASLKSPGPLRPGKNSTLHHDHVTRAARAWQTIPTDLADFWRQYHRAENPRHPLTGRRFTSPRHLFISYQVIRLHMAAPMLLHAPPPLPLWSEQHHTAAFDLGNVAPGFGFFGALHWRLGPETWADYSSWHVKRGSNSQRLREYRKVFPFGPYSGSSRWINTDWLIFRLLGRPPEVSQPGINPADVAPYVFYAWALLDDQLYCVSPRPATVREYYNRNPDPPEDITPS